MTRKSSYRPSARNPVVWMTIALALSLTAIPAYAADACCPDGNHGPDCPQGEHDKAAMAQGKTGVAQSYDSTAPHDHSSPSDSSASLPQGHPPVDQQPFAGTLFVKVTQGTTDGPALDGEQVTVQFFQRGKVILERQINLDAKGVAMIDDLQAIGVIQPVVVVEHGGIRFETVGNPMGAKQPDQVIRAMVYETTDQEPAWHISMRHVMIRAVEDGLHVTDMISLTNPEDRAWRGVESPSAEDATDAPDEPKPTTFSIALPASATHVTINKGFGTNGARLNQNTIVCSKPILPGTTEYQFSYVLPVEHGKVVLNVISPAKVAHLMAFVPEQGNQITTQGLTQGKNFRNGESLIRVYEAQNIEAQKTVSLTIEAGLAPDQPVDENADDAAMLLGLSLPKLFAGIGAAVILLAAVGLFAIRCRKHPQQNVESKKGVCV